MSELESAIAPPHSIEAERGVLGSILYDNAALDVILEACGPEDLYREQNRKLLLAMIKLHSRNEPIDIVTLVETLKAADQLADIGGSTYILELIEAIPTAANAGHYARLVREHSIRRALMQAGSAIHSESKSPDPIATVLDRCEQVVMRVAESRRDAGTMVPLRTAVGVSIKAVEAAYENPQAITGVATGFKPLDRITSGLQPSDLIILAARPSMGKTAFALNVAHSAAYTGQHVAVFSLEMATEQLVMRMLCSEARVDLLSVRSGRHAERDFPKLALAASRLAELPIHFDDTASLSIGELRSRARSLRRSNGGRLGLIVVDYLQLMRGESGGNREQEIASISRGLKALAKEMRCPVLALAQLNRQVESRADKRPGMSDLRECLTGDTLVYNPLSGERVAIKDVALGLPVVSLNASTLKNEVAKVSFAAWEAGEKEVFTLTTRTGRTIRASSGHRFYTIDGWRTLGELRDGDCIAVPRMLPSPRGQSGISMDRARLLGYLISDGSCRAQASVSYVKGDPFCVAEVRRIAEEEFGLPCRNHACKGTSEDIALTTGRMSGPGSNPLIKWLKEIGIHGQLGQDKRVPECIFTSGDDVVAAFIGTLWAGDGSVVKSKSGHWRLKFTSTSRGLLCDIQHLLLRVGVISNLGRPERNTKSTMDIATLSIASSKQITQFAQSIHIPGVKGVKLAMANEVAESTDENDQIDRIPLSITSVINDRRTAAGLSWSQLGYRCQGKRIGRERLADVARRLGDERLAALANSDILWDKIESIEPSGREMTYDVTVEPNHSFVADDIICKNSGQIEQDADVITFLYREVVYNANADPRGAELIVGKNRNGSIGMLPLTFLPEITKFESFTQDGNDF